MKIVGWNIRAGGGRRAEQIDAQLAAWGTDVAVLSEFRATPASVWIAEQLALRGLAHQLTTADPGDPARNALLVASRWPIERIAVRGGPTPRMRFLATRLATPTPMTLFGVHGPLGASGLRRPFNERLLAILKRPGSKPGLLIGDTNTGKRGIDEESPVFDERDDAFMDGMARAGWPDGFRHLHGNRREYTWYSSNKGNGFRLDEAFVHRSLLPRLDAVRYEWGRDGSSRRDAVSDHAAVIVELRAES